jgi:UDP-N-acetylglucosamine--N-acetylmuramyl-(pentapeptide) pyrophosphoryl-undecaprenol N-acetylglucosamine transferase
LVVGLGGFPSAAPLLLAACAGIPFVLFEQNSVPGKVTRCFAPAARCVYLQWDAARRFLGGARTKTVGSPLRAEFSRVDRSRARSALGIPHEKSVLCILGGSQGARKLNKLITRAAAHLNGQSDRWHILHQTGAKDLEGTLQAYRSMGVSAHVFDFERRMDLVYAAGDLFVCRAGALTLQELSYYSSPVVLVPLPTSADGHQERNAEILQSAGCAWVRSEASLDSGFLRDLVLSYESNREEFSRRGECLRRFFRHDGRDVITVDVMGSA